MQIMKDKRTQLLSTLRQVRDDLSRAIHEYHETLDVTTASDTHRTRYCVTCKVYYNAGSLNEQ